MEPGRRADVLDFYERPQPGVVRLCFDEKPCQLMGEVMAPLPMRADRIKKQDYDRVAGRYERNGHCVILLAYELDQGKRYLQVRKHRKKQDYAEFMQWLVAQHYPQTETIEVVQDNLNTHSYGAFYENLPCQQAHELKNKFHFHFTPKHASCGSPPGLNMAEIEFSALSKQCLDRRIATMEALEQEAVAWMQQRNDKLVKIDWKFNKLDARDKLQRHYKNINSNN